MQTAASPTAPTELPPPSPIPFSERIGAMDIARGLALLGIFCVNIQCFALPLIYLTTPTGLDDAPFTDTLWWLFVSTLCESKFYSLFSLLFGMGFIVLTDRADARNPRSTIRIALRRFAFLALLGFLHANLLWYGDILFIYAFGGLALLLFRRLKPRTLLTVGAILIAVGELLVWLSVALGVFFAQNPDRFTPPAPSAISAPDLTPPTTTEASEPALTQTDAPTDPVPSPAPATDAAPAEPAAPLRGWEAIKRAGGGPESEIWQTGERLAYAQGPYKDLATFRSVTWLAMFLFVLPFMGPRILGLFLIGAYLIRTDFFNPSKARLHRRLVTLGLAVGIPCAAVAATGRLMTWNDGAMHISWLLWQVFYAIGAILIPLMIISAAARLSDIASRSPGNTLARALHPLACTGRMALTNYLTQTLVATTVFYFYGFGLFGTFSGLERAALVFGVYAAQLAISPLWLKHFSMGPMEWLWRSATYLTFPRIGYTNDPRTK